MGLSLKKPEGVPGAAWPAIVIGLFVSFGGVLFGYDVSYRCWYGIQIEAHTMIDRHDIRYPGDAILDQRVQDSGVWYYGLRRFSDRLYPLCGNSYRGAPRSTHLRLDGSPNWSHVFLRDRLQPGCHSPSGFHWSATSYCWTVLCWSWSWSFECYGASVSVRDCAKVDPWNYCWGVPACHHHRKFQEFGELHATDTLSQGLFLAACVNYATGQRNDSGSYRIPLAVQFLWSLIIVVGLLFLPETPRFLIKQSKHEKAAQSLSKLRRLDPDHPAIIEELAEIRANHEYELRLGKASYADCFKGSIGVRLATGCFLQGLQQLSGINFIVSPNNSSRCLGTADTP